MGGLETAQVKSQQGWQDLRLCVRRFHGEEVQEKHMDCNGHKCQATVRESWLLHWSFHVTHMQIRRRQWHPAPVLLPGNPMDGAASQAAVHGVAKSRARLSNFTFTFRFHALEQEWQPTPVFLPGESQGRGSLVGCRLWGRTESDTTDETQQQQQHMQIDVEKETRRNIWG